MKMDGEFKFLCFLVGMVAGAIIETLFGGFPLGRRNGIK